MRKKVLTVTAIVSGIYVAALWVITSHAAGTEVVTQPLDNLKTLVIAVIGAVGLIILAKNIMEFAQAYQNQDSSSIGAEGNRGGNDYGDDFAGTFLPWILKLDSNRREKGKRGENRIWMYLSWGTRFWTCWKWYSVSGTIRSA